MAFAREAFIAEIKQSNLEDKGERHCSNKVPRGRWHSEPLKGNRNR